jgi:hypothetical protein
MMNVIAYDAAFRTLVLVPVGGTALPIDRSTLERELNRIYGQAAVQWAVRTEEGFQSTYDTNNNGLDYGSSGLLSNYTAEMRTILKDYTRSRSLAPHTYYLFVVPRANQSEVTGYMPRRRQAGFLFADNITAANATKIIAHELGHGAFRLKHTFPELPQNGNNLMDYSTAGITLHKHQWDDIHNPQTVPGLFEGDEEGAKYDCPKWFSISTDCESVGKMLEYIKKAVNENKKLIVSWPTGKPEFAAENIELDGVRYDKIKVINSVQKGGEVTFDPKSYESFSQDVPMSNGKMDVQRGFVFKTETKGLLPLSYFEVITVLLYQEKDFEDRLESLRAYLFGDNTPSDESIIKINVNTKLILENELNTFSSFSIDDGKVTGYFIERGKGTSEEERQRGSKKRIPGGLYEFVDNNCERYYDQLGKKRRPNCMNEFRIITTTEKSGTRDGVLIHTGSDYQNSTGCLIPVGPGYGEENVIVAINDDRRTLKKYTSNGTSDKTLEAIKSYIVSIQKEAEEKKKTVKMLININR